MSAQRLGGHLVESAPRPRRGARPLLASSAVHCGLIAFAVVTTMQPRVTRASAEQEHVRVVDFAAFAPPPQGSAPAVQRPAPGFQILAVPPLEIPAEIPGVDMTRPATVTEDFTGRGVLGGVGGGIEAAPLSFGTGLGEPIDGAMADQAPYLLPGQMGPAYPDLLRDRAPDGVVVVRFVIDTLGQVEQPSFKVVEANHPLFVASVRTALDHLRFFPAHFSGQRVRVRMEQRFEFHLAVRH